MLLILALVACVDLGLQPTTQEPVSALDTGTDPDPE